MKTELEFWREQLTHLDKSDENWRSLADSGSKLNDPQLVQFATDSLERNQRDRQHVQEKIEKLTRNEVVWN